MSTTAPDPSRIEADPSLWIANHFDSPSNQPKGHVLGSRDNPYQVLDDVRARFGEDVEIGLPLDGPNGEVLRSDNLHGVYAVASAVEL